MVIPNAVFDDATRMHKSVVIAKSGIYKYAKQELGGFSGLDSKVPEQHKSKTIFNVFRPPEVLDAAQKLFARQPATVEHPPEFLTPDNIQKYIVGWTGDSVSVEKHANGHDVLVKSSVNLLDRDALNAYDDNIREVSPGYKAVFVWQDGETTDSIPYQIVMKEITEVNHLALTEAGRGGKDAAITDHKGAKGMDLLDQFKKFLGIKERVLDSLPRNGDYTDEEKKYLFREVHRLLDHLANGKVMDSFTPEGFETKKVVKDSPERADEDEKKGDKPVEDDDKEVENKTEDEEKPVEDTVTTEAEKGFAETAKHPDEKPSGSDKEKPAGEPPTTKVADSKPGSHLTSVSDVTDSANKQAFSFDEAFRSGKLHLYLKENK